MVTQEITLPRLGLIAGTRAALGAGAGLLLAERLSPEQRRAVGWTLLAVGVLTTFPLAAEFLLGGRRGRPGAASRPPVRREPEVVATR
jgi:uncharacterized membrane protein YfcA